MTTPAQPIEPQDKNELVIVAVKIPRVLVALLDNAASNDWETRNTVVRRALEQYFDKN